MWSTLPPPFTGQIVEDQPPSAFFNNPRHRRVKQFLSQVLWRTGANPYASGHFPANGIWLAIQVMAHNLARWTARLGLGEPVVTTKTLRRRFFSLAGRLTRSARRPPCICPSAGLGKPSSVALWPDCEPCHSQPDDARLPLTRPPTERPRQLAPSRSARGTS